MSKIDIELTTTTPRYPRYVLTFDEYLKQEKESRWLDSHLDNEEDGDEDEFEDI